MKKNLPMQVAPSVSFCRRMVVFSVIASHVWTSTLLAGGGGDLSTQDKSLHRSARSSQHLPENLLSDYQKKITAKGTWDLTDSGLLLRAQGDVILDTLTLDRNLCIFTDGSIFFKGQIQLDKELVLHAQKVYIDGSLIANGYTHLTASELLIAKEKTFTALQGAQLTLKKLDNNGLLSVFGAGISGEIAKFSNGGKIDLATALMKVKSLHNGEQGILRTAGHFILHGETLENRGTFFTAGVQQIILKNSYIDGGHLYAPTLLLVEAPRIDFLPTHTSWLREGMISAAHNLTMGTNTKFHMRSDRAACFLQLASKGDLHYDGYLQQLSSSFPWHAYDEIWKNTSKKFFPDGHGSTRANPKLIYEGAALKAWDRVRKSLSGVTFSTQGDLKNLKGSVSLSAGSVRAMIGNAIKSTGSSLKAGTFTGDNLVISSQKAYLDAADFFAPNGKFSLTVTGEATLKNTKLSGYESASLKAQTLTMENQSLVKSLIGAGVVQVSGSATVTDSGVEARTTGVLKAQTLRASGLEMRGDHTHVMFDQGASIQGSVFQGTQSNDIVGGGALEFSDNKLASKQSTVRADSIRAEGNATEGDLLYQGQKYLSTHNEEIHGDGVFLAKKIEHSGDLTGTSLHSQGDHIINNADAQAKKSLVFDARILEQRHKTSGKSVYLRGSESYIDLTASLNEAQDQFSLVAPNTKRKKGRDRAPLGIYHLGATNAEDFLDLMDKISVNQACLLLPQADLHFTQDVSLKPNIVLKARSFKNYEPFHTQGDFAAQLSTYMDNEHTVDIQGKGYFEAPDSLTSRGTMIGHQGLSLHTQGLLTHKGGLSGGMGVLEMRAFRIDSMAEGLNKRSFFYGDGVDAYAEHEFLADGAVVRTRDGSLGAGDLLRLGAYKETFRSEKEESGLFGLTKTTTKESWQEAIVFDAQATQKLKLYSVRGRIQGEGAQLHAPLLQLHAEQGFSLGALGLQRTKIVEKSGLRFEVLGVNLVDPLGDGFPGLKPSAEVGFETRRTEAQSSYGLLGGISAQRLVVTTGVNGTADLRGSHLSTSHLVTNTPSLKLGGSAFEETTKSDSFKATAGIAWRGSLAPAGSVSRSSNTQSLKGFQSAQVHISHLENHYEGMDFSGSNGIIGGIMSSSGASFKATIDHGQTIHSQSGWTGGFGLSGDVATLSLGGSWGAKKTSQGTDFSITNAPNLTKRQDIRYEDSDTRAGISGNLALSLDGSSLLQVASGGLSIQVKDQHIGFDVSMTRSSSSNPTTSAFTNFVNSTTDMVSQVRSIATGVSNVTAVAALAGVNTQGVQTILDDVQNGLTIASSLAESLSTLESLGPLLNPIQPSREEYPTIQEGEEGATTVSSSVAEDEEELQGSMETSLIAMPLAQMVPLNTEEDGGREIPDNLRRDISSQAENPITSRTGPTLAAMVVPAPRDNSEPRAIEGNSFLPIAVQGETNAEPIRFSTGLEINVFNSENAPNTRGNSGEEATPDNRVLVITNGSDFSVSDFSLNPLDWRLRPEDSYAFVPREWLIDITQSGELTTQRLGHPNGFSPLLLAQAPQNLLENFYSPNPAMVRLYSVASRRAPERQIFDTGLNIAQTGIDGCATAVAFALVVNGPVAVPAVPEICMIGAGVSLVTAGLSRVAGKVTYDIAHQFNASQEKALTYGKVIEEVTSFVLDMYSALRH